MMTLAAVLCCALTLVFTGCKPGDKVSEGGDIKGSWYADVTGKTYSLWNYGPAWQQTTFNADGTGTTSIYYTVDTTMVAYENNAFTYTTNNGTLTMTMSDNRTITTGYTVKDNVLEMNNDKMDLSYAKMTDEMAVKFDEWSKKEGLGKVDAPAKHTVFVYGNAGGDMDDIIEQGFWEKTQQYLTDSSNVRVVCMYKYGKDGIDQYGDHIFTGKYAAPGDVVWFELKSTTDLNKIKEQGFQALGMEEEAQSLKICSPVCLRMFIEFSSLVCPAEQYTFVIWGHGSGFNPKEDFPDKYTSNPSAPRRAPQGVIADEWNAMEALDMYELRDGILSTGAKKMYTIFFHNCLMGNIETLTEIKDYTDYIFTSSHIFSSNGEVLREYVRALIDKGNTEDAATQLFSGLDAVGWPNGYKSFLKSNNGDFKLIRTDKFEPILGAVKRLADRLVATYPTQQAAIDTATTHVYCYLPHSESTYPFYDIADYAQLIAKETNDEEFKTISADLDQALSNAIIQYRDVSWTKQHLEHYTLSVCLVPKAVYTADTKSEEEDPSVVRNFDEGYEQSLFHKKTGWGNWLKTNEQWLVGNPKCGGGGNL